MMTLGEALSVLLAVLAAATAGLVGSFALMKRITLAGDAISHIALPGLGLALLFKIQPILGGAATLVAGAVLIWKLQRHTSLSTETAIGVIFSSALAVGALVTPSEDLVEALFGNFQALSPAAFAVYAALSFLVVGFIFGRRNQLLLSIFSPDLAAATGVNIDRLNLLYLLSFVATIILGLRFLGALLVGALIIIPAATSYQLTHQLRSFLLVSTLASVAAVGAGLAVSRATGLALGPSVVSLSAAFFLLSFLKRKT
jgi:ABC-type Mn2+/Zn2+ transport system permease subunit